MNNFELGFIKRAQEYGIDRYQAIELLKQAAPQKSREQQAEEYMPMNFLGGLGDYLTPGGFGGSRAGKMTAMSKALGKDPGYSTTNPLSSSLIGSLVGGGLGAGLGGGIGHALGTGEPSPDGGLSRAAIGAMLGGSLGSFAGSVVPAALRRGEYKENLEEFKNGAKINPERPQKLKGLGNILLPFSGAHRKGEAVGYNKLQGKQVSETGDHWTNTARALPYIGAPTALIGGISQNYTADKMIGAKKR